MPRAGGAGYGSLMRWVRVTLVIAVIASGVAGAGIAVTHAGTAPVPDAFADPPAGSRVVLNHVLCDGDDGHRGCTRYVVLAALVRESGQTLLTQAGALVSKVLGYKYVPDTDPVDFALEGRGYVGTGEGEGAQVSDIPSALKLDAILFSGSNKSEGQSIAAAERATPSGVVVRILGADY